MAVIEVRPNKCIMCDSEEHTVVARGTDYQYGTTEEFFSWCACKNCGHYYIDPIPTEDALGSIYPKTLGNYLDFDAKPGISFRVKRFFDGYSLKKITRKIEYGGRALDVGCAAGTLLDLIKVNCPNIETLHGLEISEAAAQVAIAKGYKIFIDTVENADLNEDYYDIIYLQQVIEHVHEPHQVVSKLHRSLRPGGILVMETPALGSWDHMVFNNGFWEGYHIPRHFNLWTVSGMRIMLENTGFKSFRYNYRIKPVHWTVSSQNWAVHKKLPNWIKKQFDVRNPLPLPLIFFGAVDVIQLLIGGRGSDIQYIASK